MRQHRQVIIYDCRFTNRSYGSFCYKLDILSLSLFADISWPISIPSHSLLDPAFWLRYLILEMDNSGIAKLRKPNLYKVLFARTKNENSFILYTQMAHFKSLVSSLNCRPNRQQFASLGAHCTLLLAPVQEGGWAGSACQGRWPPVRGIRCLILGGEVTLGWPYLGYLIISSAAGAQFGGLV